MKNDIYYKTWGYDKTIVSFFKVVKETEFFITFKQMDKVKIKNTPQDGLVIPSETETEYETFKVKKKKYLTYRVWDGTPQEENYNYTYQGL